MVRDSDFHILEMLRENSRTSFVKIGEDIGVTEAAIRKRVKKFQEKGIIRRFTIDINPKRMGLEMDALIGIDTTPESYMKVIEKVKSIDQIISVYSCSGDHMILIQVWLKNSDALSEFTKKLEGINGVTKICPALITERIK